MSKLTAVCQARMSSTRLPGKVLKEIFGKSILQHLIIRLKKAKSIDDIIIATSIDKSDDMIENECKKIGVKCFRGSLEDVLSRFYNACLKFELQNNDLMRICCDSPLLDWNMIDEIAEIYKNSNYDIVRNDKVPVGFAVELFNFKWLEKAYKNASKDYQREHVTPYIYENGKCFLHNNIPDYSDYRFTLDTKEDFLLLEEIFKELYCGEHNFGMNDIIELMKRKPELKKINQNIVQKTSSINYIKNK